MGRCGGPRGGAFSYERGIPVDLVMAYRRILFVQKPEIRNQKGPQGSSMPGQLGRAVGLLLALFQSDFQRAALMLKGVSGGSSLAARFNPGEDSL